MGALLERFKETRLWQILKDFFWVKEILVGLWKNKYSRTFLCILFAFYLAGIIGFMGSIMGFLDYEVQNLGVAFKGPSFDHPLGTDQLGREMWIRVLVAMGTTAVISVFVAFSGSLILAVGLGTLSGYKGGKTDLIIMTVGQMLYSIPSILLLMLIIATAGVRYGNFFQGIVNFTGWEWLTREGIDDFILVFGALSVIGWVMGARVIRSKVLSIRETQYIEAARALGGSTCRILSKHILPNLSWLLCHMFLGGLAGAIFAEIGLSFLGLGIQPPHPSFGTMLLDTASNLSFVLNHLYLFLVPAIIVSIWLFTLVQLEIAATKIASVQKA